MLIPQKEEFSRCVACRYFKSNKCLSCRFNCEEIGTIEQAHFTGDALHIDVRFKKNYFKDLKDKDTVIVGWSLSFDGGGTIHA